MGSTFTLGTFWLDGEREMLFRGSEPVALGRRAVALLRALVENPGMVVSKDRLIEAAWPGQAVEESNLSVQVAALRRVLGSEPGGARWIETLPRRGYRFVGQVVEVQRGAAAAPPQAEPAPGGAAAPHHQVEQRQITALCCELVGVAAGADGRGLEELRRTVAEWRRRLGEIAGRHSGRVASRLGNAELILFGWPAAHEADAERAVRAGLELCATVRTLRSGAERPLRCRVGIATGMVIIGDGFAPSEGRGPDIVGDPADLALQLQLSAPAGTVAIGPATRRLIGGLFDCRELGAIDANGGGGPLHYWQVLAESAVESRFDALHPVALTPLVGRAEEIEFLLRRWRQAKRGDGQIVLLGGEPGIGKSRLAAVLSETLAGEPHMRLRCFCSPHHADSALYPTIAQLAHAAGFAAADNAANKQEKLQALLRQTGATPEETALFADLLSLPGANAGSPIDGLTPQQKKERTFAALVRQLETLARTAPVLMLFEDAHWADPSSGELLDRVVERIPRLPVLLVVTFRPEYRPQWTGQPSVAALTLGRLSRHEVALLAENAAGGKTLPDEVVERLVERTDGVPLFVEELTKSVLESGLLRVADDRYVLNGALPLLTIPASLHDSLTARLDRAATSRKVAQIGAAIGRRFPYALVRAASGLREDELQEALARLVAAELVFQRGTPPDAVYSFKHALVQDAAYASLLRASRRELHAQIAAALETGFPDVTETEPELLARHYAEAGLAEKSVAYWSKAGQRSAARSAMVEATAQLQKGLDQLALLPDTPQRQRQELELRSALGGALIAVKGLPAEVGRTYDRARELWEQLGAPSEFLHIPYGQSRYYAHRGQLGLAQRLAEDLLRVSRERNDTGGLVLGHFACGRNAMFGGDFARARSHFTAVLALFDPGTDASLVHQVGFHPQITARAYLAIVLFCLGFSDQALSQSNAAIAEGRGLAHPESLVASLSYGATLLSFVGDNLALEELAGQLDAFPTEQGFSHWQIPGTICRGWVMVRNGEMAKGMSLLRAGLTAYRAVSSEAWRTVYDLLHARACGIVGRLEEGMALLEKTLHNVTTTEERWLAAELNRCKGDLLLRQGHVEGAEELYCKALGIAREQEAKLWELRAAMSLARLWCDRGRRGDARDLLAPVYGWFTEGFATPDLAEAKALLDEIG